MADEQITNGNSQFIVKKIMSIVQQFVRNTVVAVTKVLQGLKLKQMKYHLILTEK